MHDLLKQTEHRPYPLPQQPWGMEQTWSNLLFAHWPLAPDVIAPHIPPGLTLDTFEGHAWISVVPFSMRNIRPRMTVAVPWLSAFAELNVRTYVTADDKPGVYFFSLDAANPVGVWIARTWYKLPYFNADMRVEKDTALNITYTSYRQDKRAPAGDFDATYQPTSEVFHASPGTLDYFLTERYCLYTVGRGGNVLRGDIHHQRWPLQAAKADIRTNTVSVIPLPDTAPILQYVDCLDVLAWPLVRV